MSRGGVPVVEFVDDPQVMRAAMGRLVAIADLGLLAVNAGLGVVGAGGAGTSLPATRCALDTADAWCDQVRIVVHGENSDATTHTVQLYDVTNSVVLATVTIGDTLQTYIGSWTALAAQGGDRTIEVRVVGDGADTQTLYSIHAQFRTVRFQQ